MARRRSQVGKPIHYRRSNALSLVLAVLLAGPALAGCVGDGSSTDPVTATDDSALNPWQAGLADRYPTPDFVETRSRDERRANLAPPGDPEFAAFDAVMQTWMEKHDVPAGQLAIMKDGQLRYERGYGNVDREATTETDVDTMFRMASVTKPVTAALVSMQVEQGLYNWSDPVFCVPPDNPAPECRLPIEPHPANPVEDPRIADVTVRQLVEHTAGWGRPATWVQEGEGAIEVADELGIPSPPPAWRTAQYLMGEWLEDHPGERYAYCNVCYMLAGLVAEAATGADLGALYDAYLFRPLDVTGDIEPGRTLPEERNPREPFYVCEEEWANVYAPGEAVCAPDGGFALEEALEADGGLVATASAIAAVYAAHLPLVPPGCDGTCYVQDGSLPGTHSAATVLVGDDGGTSQFVYSFNARDTGEHCDALPVDAMREITFEATGIPFSAGCSNSDFLASMILLTLAWEDAAR